MNIKKLILQDEGIKLDFKKTISQKERIARTMVSFANTYGGILLIGIDDEKRITGVKSEEEEKYMITEAATNYCKPPLEPVFEEHFINDKLVLSVEIAESASKPHYALDEDKKWWVYIRSNDKSILASKVVMDVMKKRSTHDPVLIEYTSREKELLHYLSSHKKITLKEYSELIHAPRRKAARILVNFILTGLIQVHNSNQTEYYTAS